MAEVVVVEDGNSLDGEFLGIALTFSWFHSGRPRTVSREEPVDEDEGEEDNDEDDEDEARIPGMPSKPCPQCDERFTTREGFLEHIVVHSSKISI